MTKKPETTAKPPAGMSEAETPRARRIRLILGAAIDLADGKDPIEIGKYGFEPRVERLAEIFRAGKADGPRTGSLIDGGSAPKDVGGRSVGASAPWPPASHPRAIAPAIRDLGRLTGEARS